MGTWYCRHADEIMTLRRISHGLSCACLAVWFVFFISKFGYGAANVQHRLEVGSSLKPGSKNDSFLISPNGTFAFGFYPTAPNSKSFGVGIWYYKIAKVFVVWTPDRASGWGAVGSGWALELTETGDFVLKDDSGSPVWRTNTSGKSVAAGELLDSGNFVLRKNVSDGVVWSSFDQPTNTLLPGQIFTQNSTLKSDGTRPYRYSLSFRNIGSDVVFALYWNESKIYRNITVGHRLMSSVLDNSGRFVVRNASEATAAWWVSSDYQDTTLPLRRVTLDVDGNLRIHSWDAQAGVWKVGWQALENECEINGYCGLYGLCTYIDSYPRASCICPPGFIPVSKEKNWTSEGCTTLAPLTCPTPQVIRLENTVWFWDESDFVVGTAISETNCSNTFRQTPAATAATFPNNGSGLCIQKRVSFVSGYQLPSIRSISFLRICGEALMSQAPAKFECPAAARKDIYTSVFKGVISTSASLNAIMLFLILILYRHCQKRGAIPSEEDLWVPLLFNLRGSPVTFTFRMLQDATANFSEKLGSGGFGSVYKGMISRTNTPVAVKRLEDIHDDDKQGDEEFRTEVALIGRTHHFNLVHLVGFCMEGSHRLLVYEYMLNGSLDKHLFTEREEVRVLDWKSRLNIAIGSARGIAYLHEQCSKPIVHCDIKPENILLDANMQPKVADFGLSKMIGRTLTTRSSGIRGSPGYIAPEWLADLPITCKADVFSFGIVLLEIVGGRRNVDPSLDEERRIYSQWAFHMAKEGKYIDVVDRELGDEIDIDEVRRMLIVAFWCIQGDFHVRPSMGKIAHMLEGSIPTLELPHSVDSRLLHCNLSMGNASHNGEIVTSQY